MADTAIGSAYLNIIPKMASDAASTIASQATDGLGGAATSAGELFGGNLLAGMKGPLIGAGVVLGGVMGLGKLAGDLMGIGETFDTMTDTIITGTGASGAALEGLVESAKEIATTVPTSFEAAGDIVQNLNTRMGLVGDELEAVGQRVVAAGELLGQDINLDNLTGAFNAFGVANEEAAAKMDYLFNVGQATGISFNDLAGIIEKNAPALQNLGFSFEESANMAGLLDKAGMDASGTMAKMSKALTELAKPGQSAAEAYREVIAEMQSYIEQGDTAAAIDIASAVFGTKGAAQFVGALQSGALSMEELQNAALGAGDGIMGTMEKTMDWPERWEILKNKATEALEPIGGALMEGASSALEKFSEALDNVDPAFFDTLADGVAQFIEDGAQVLIDGIQWFIDNKDQVGETLTGFAEGAMAFGTAIGTVADVIGTSFSIAIESVGFFISLLAGDMEGAKEHVVSAADTIGEKLGFPGLGDTVSTAFDSIEKFMEDPIGNAVGILGGFVDDIIKDLGFDGVANTVSSVFSSIQQFMEDPVGTAVGVLGGFVDQIKALFNFEIQWPHIPLPHFSVSGSANPLDWLEGGLPQISIEWYAAGGMVNGATLIGAGERGPELIWPSYEPYLTQYADAIASQMDNNRGDIYNVYLNVEDRNDFNAMARAFAEAVQTQNRLTGRASSMNVRFA